MLFKINFALQRSIGVLPPTNQPLLESSEKL
jgi:hypothetical protein